MILVGGVPTTRLTDSTPGVQMDANDKTSVLDDVDPAVGQQLDHTRHLGVSQGTEHLTGQLVDRSLLPLPGGPLLAKQEIKAVNGGAFSFTIDDFADGVAGGIKFKMLGEHG